MGTVEYRRGILKQRLGARPFAGWGWGHSSNFRQQADSRTVMPARKTPKPRGNRLPVRSVASLPVLVLAAGFASPAASQDAQPVCRDGEARIVGVIVDAVAGPHWSRFRPPSSTWSRYTAGEGTSGPIRTPSCKRAVKIRLLPMPIW